MAEAMRIMDLDAFPVNPASDRICEMLLKRVNDLPDADECDHEGENHRIEMIEVSPLPWDHIDLGAFRLELIRATLVPGWFICRRRASYWNHRNAEWENISELRGHPKNFAYDDVLNAVQTAEQLIDQMQVGRFRWYGLPPADSQFQEFADKLAALAARKG
jgi:hypothetical protein